MDKRIKKKKNLSNNYEFKKALTLVVYSRVIYAVENALNCSERESRSYIRWRPFLKEMNLNKRNTILKELY
jgi:hypothetical protein